MLFVLSKKDYDEGAVEIETDSSYNVFTFYKVTFYMYLLECLVSLHAKLQKWLKFFTSPYIYTLFHIFLQCFPTVGKVTYSSP